MNDFPAAALWLLSDTSGAWPLSPFAAAAAAAAAVARRRGRLNLARCATFSIIDPRRPSFSPLPTFSSSAVLFPSVVESCDAPPLFGCGLRRLVLSFRRRSTSLPSVAAARSSFRADPGARCCCCCRAEGLLAPLTPAPPPSSSSRIESVLPRLDQRKFARATPLPPPPPPGVLLRRGSGDGALVSSPGSTESGPADSATLAASDVVVAAAAAVAAELRLERLDGDESVRAAVLLLPLPLPLLFLALTLEAALVADALVDRAGDWAAAAALAFDAAAALALLDDLPDPDDDRNFRLTSRVSGHSALFLLGNDATPSRFEI